MEMIKTALRRLQLAGTKTGHPTGTRGIADGMHAPENVRQAFPAAVQAGNPHPTARVFREVPFIVSAGKVGIPGVVHPQVLLQHRCVLMAVDPDITNRAGVRNHRGYSKEHKGDYGRNNLYKLELH